MSRILFVGGPLHGARLEVPDNQWTVRVPTPIDFVTALLDPDPYVAEPPPISYQRVRWPYRVDLFPPDEHMFVMLGPITEDRPAVSGRADDPRYIYIADRMWRARAEELIPQCVVPDCVQKGRYVFIADEPGRLAGREWNYGDKIRVCPKHAMDIYQAQVVYGIDELAEWLQPDAKLDPLDAYDASYDSLYGREIARQRSRALRMRPTDL